jgi:hypothetical protein
MHIFTAVNTSNIEWIGRAFPEYIVLYNQAYRLHTHILHDSNERARTHRIHYVLTTNENNVNSVSKKVKKSKAVPLHAMQAYWGRGGTAPTHS